MMMRGRGVRLTFLGCGHIGKALLGALLPSISKACSPISQVTVALKRKESEAQLRDQFRHSQTPVTFVADQNIEVVKNADAILFAFPPDQIHAILGADEMKDALRHKTIISILARTPLSEITRLLQKDQNHNTVIDNSRIIRAMPTMGTEVHESATLIAGPGIPGEEEAVKLATWIFSIVGKVYHVSHDYFDTATGISAFSNALTTVATQVITQKAIAEGVPLDHAVAITSQCIRGSASLMLEGASPEQLQQSLSAPGSITAQAISQLQDNNRLQRLLESSLSAAIFKAQNYSK